MMIRKLLRIMLPILLVLMMGAFGFVEMNTGIGVVEAQTFGSGWSGVYYNNNSLSGSPVISRIDQTINFNWGAGPPTGFESLLPPDNFSVRWSSLETFDQPGTYRFTASADDGVRVIIDGTTVIDNFQANNGLTLNTADVNITAGTREIVLEYVEFTGNAAIQFFWEPFNVGDPEPTATPPNTALPPIPPGALTATVIRAGALNVRETPSLGGNIIGRIIRGETYAITGRDADARWFVLQLGGYEGWVYGYYLFINGNEFNPPIRSATSIFGIPPGFNDTGVLVQTRATMRLRESPNVFARQTGRITWGALIPVSGRTAAGDWYQVLWRGTIGWVFTGYLEIRQGAFEDIPIVQ
ncbi:MAG: SH3 domain-containing protein [Anaerolineae bacterium]